MSKLDPIWVLIGVVVAVGIVVVLWVLSPNARLRRRLRKTHSRIVSKSRQPTVRLSVKPPKRK